MAETMAHRNAEAPRNIGSLVIIDAQSGTVVPLDSCYLVDLSELDEDDKHFLDVASDSEISGMAIRKGKNILKIMEDNCY